MAGPKDNKKASNDPGTRKEAFPAFHFEVEIDGSTYPFRSCSGLKSETKPVTVEEGGVNTHVHQLVGQTSFPPLTLKQGFCDAASPLYNMYLDFTANEAKPGQGKKRFNGSIRQIGPNGTAAKWVFNKAWISKWEGPDLDATKNEISIESIEIVHEGLYLAKSSGGVTDAAKKKTKGGFSLGIGEK